MKLIKRGKGFLRLSEPGDSRDNHVNSFLDPPLPPDKPPRKEKVKRFLSVHGRKHISKSRLWIALYRYTGPGHNGPEDLKFQRRLDPDEITPAEDPEERKYHWAFLVGPKEDKNPYSTAVAGSRIELTEDTHSRRWVFNRHLEVNIRNTGPDMLVRVLIAKIPDHRRFFDAVLRVDIDQDSRLYRNKAWVFEVMTALQSGVGEGYIAERARLDPYEVGAIIKDMAGKRIAAKVYDVPWSPNVARPAFDMMEGRWLWEG